MTTWNTQDILFYTFILKFCNHLCTCNSENPDLQFLKFCGIGIITLLPTENLLNFRFVVLISFSAWICCPDRARFRACWKIGLSSSIPKELLPQLETELDLEQILADAGEGDTTDGTTDDDESPPIYLRQTQISIFPLPRHFSLHHL